MWFLVGIPIGIFALIVWANIVKTSPTIADDERIRGWESVVRELPATIVMLGVVVIGLALAVRAGRGGDTEGAQRAIVWHGVGLFVILLIIGNGSAENIMTTRPSTVKWLLLPVQVGLAILSVIISRRLARSAR